MLNLICHSTHRYRAWLIALAAILLLATILEAGHVHGVFAAEDDHCTLCQHAIALDKILGSSLGFILPLLLCALVNLTYRHLIPTANLELVSIRAPPQYQHP